MTIRETILENVRQVPSLPISATEILHLLQDPEVSVTDLQRAIEFDPGLTSNLLHLANSAYFGGYGEIENVHNAIVRLGLKRVYHVVIASLVAPMARRPIKGYDMPPGAFLEHSVMSAIATEKIAESFEVEPPAHAFTCGLLHAIGKMVLGTFVEVDINQILHMAYEEKVPFHTAERQVLGIDHPEVGAVLLEHWRLPRRIAEVVRWHKDPDVIEGDRTVVNLVHLADHLVGASGIGSGLDGQNYSPAASALEQFPLTTEMAESIVLQTVTSFKELVRYFPTAAEA